MTAERKHAVSGMWQKSHLETSSLVAQALQNERPLYRIDNGNPDHVIMKSPEWSGSDTKSTRVFYGRVTMARWKNDGGLKVVGRAEIIDYPGPDPGFF